MNSHFGDAILCLNDGRLLNVNADLNKDHTGTWSGTLFAKLGAASTSNLANLTEGTILIGNRTGAFVRPDTSDWLDSPQGEFQLCILGNGDAPF